MKKQSLFIMFLLLTIVGMAKAAEVEIPLRQISASSESKKNNQKGGIRHVPQARTKLPIVILDGNILTINSFSNGATLTLAMYDEYGNVIYDMVAGTSTWSVSIPSNIIDNTSSLRLVINDKIYIGEL